MNENEFSDALGEIHGSYVTEAVTYRKRGRWIPWAAVAASLVLMLNLLLPVSINEFDNPPDGAHAYWAAGIPLSMPQIGESDLIVESVRIDMDVQTLSHYGTDSIGTASIEMALHNPTDETIAVPMTLPCGQAPHYLYTYDEDYNSLLTYPVQSLYCFTLNDTAVSANHLITATDAAPDEDRAQATGRIALDSPVTKYTYRITELEKSENPRLAILGFSRNSDNIVLVKTQYFKLLHADGEIIIPIRDSVPRVNDTFTAYVIGDSSDFNPAWYMIDWNTQERLNNTIVLEATETTTFLDFSNESWNDQLGITRENWAFNVAAAINHFSHLNSENLEDFSSVSIWSHHWLTYELTLAPGETATHRIELPLYPDYSGFGFCTYHVDLVSLRALSSTGSENLTLTTPFSMDKTSVQWTQDDATYNLDLRELNDLDMYFRLVVPKSTEPVDPDMGIIPSRDWLSWLCAAVLVGLFFLHRKYRKERF